MARAVIVMVGLASLLLSSCTERMICPAFQSAFIFDQEQLRKKFSYFREDSTPKILTASKTKYLVATPVSYRKKERGLQIVPMRTVKPVIPDSLQVDQDLEADDLAMTSDSLSSAAADSTAIGADSAYVITVDREVRVIRYDPIKRQYSIEEVGLNLDQDNYLWYLRDVLVLPDVRLAHLGEDEGKGSAPGGRPGGSKKKGNFFQRLFGKKQSTTPDSLSTAAPDDADAATPQKKRKGLFSGKKEETKPAQQEDQAPAEKKDDEGF